MLEQLGDLALRDTEPFGDFLIRKALVIQPFYLFRRAIERIGIYEDDNNLLGQIIDGIFMAGLRCNRESSDSRRNGSCLDCETALQIISLAPFLLDLCHDDLAANKIGGGGSQIPEWERSEGTPGNGVRPARAEKLAEVG